VSGSDSQGDPDDRFWTLYRLVVNPQDTFTGLMGKSNQGSLPSKDASNWVGVGVSESIVGSKGSNYLVQNVVNFEVDFHVQDDDDSSTATLVTDADGTIYGGQSGVPPTVGPQAHPGANSPQLLAYRQPLAHAEIRLIIVSDEGARLLQNINKIPETEEEVIRQHGEVFTRRVNLLARPL
jgi:hypothetical protein